MLLNFEHGDSEISPQSPVECHTQPVNNQK